MFLFIAPYPTSSHHVEEGLQRSRIRAISTRSTISSSFLSPLHMHIYLLWLTTSFPLCFFHFPSSIFLCYSFLYSVDSLSVSLYISSGSSTLPADDLRSEEAWLWLISCSKRRSLCSSSFCSSAILAFFGRVRTTSFCTSLFALLGSGDGWPGCLGFLVWLAWLGWSVVRMGSRAEIWNVNTLNRSTCTYSEWNTLKNVKIKQVSLKYKYNFCYILNIA